MRSVVYLVYAVLAVAFGWSMPAQAEESQASKPVSTSTPSELGKIALYGARVVRARFPVAPVDGLYYGVYRTRIDPGADSTQRLTSHRAARPNGYYYSDWRQTFSPYWGLGVATELIATAPAFYYYGVGFGDPYGHEVLVYEKIVSYCGRFRSYNPSSGTYIGADGSPHSCP